MSQPGTLAREGSLAVSIWAGTEPEAWANMSWISLEVKNLMNSQAPSEFLAMKGISRSKPAPQEAGSLSQGMREAPVHLFRRIGLQVPDIRFRLDNLWYNDLVVPAVIMYNAKGGYKDAVHWHVVFGSGIGW
jgi:hypothetical protein